MRFIPIATLGFLAIIALALGIVWTQRIPITEWTLEVLVAEKMPHPPHIKVNDVSLDAISFAEIRLRYFGEISVQELHVGVKWEDGLVPIVSHVQAGSVSADLSIPSINDLFSLVSSEPADAYTSSTSPTIEMPALTVEKFDLHIETQEGYLLADGSATIPHRIPLSDGNVLRSVLATSPVLSINVTVGAAEISVRGIGHASGTAGFSIRYRDGIAEIHSLLPPSLYLTLTHPTELFPGLPIGAYAAEVGSDTHPASARFTLSVTDSDIELAKVDLDAFPFLVELENGYVSGSARVSDTDPDALPNIAELPEIFVDAFVDIQSFPLPGGGTTSLNGNLSVAGGLTNTITLQKGFEVDVDVSKSDHSRHTPQDVQKLLSHPAKIRILDDVVSHIEWGKEDASLTADGTTEILAGPLSGQLIGPFSGKLSNERVTAEFSEIALAADPEKGEIPIPERLSVSLRETSIATSQTKQFLESKQLEVLSNSIRFVGPMTIKRRDELLTAGVRSGTADLPTHGVGFPELDILIAVKEGQPSLKGEVSRVLLEGIEAIKVPVMFEVDAKPTGSGFLITAEASLEDAATLNVNGVIAGSDAEMEFVSTPITLGNGGISVSSLTDLIDLGEMRPQGSVQASGLITYTDDELGGYVDLSIDEIGTKLGDGSRISVKGDVRLDPSAFPRTIAPATLAGTHTSAYLGAIPFVESFSIRESGEINLHELTAQFLGGNVKVVDTVADPEAGSITGKVLAETISLKALAGLLEIEGLDTTGQITGALDFHVGTDTIVLENGDLRSIAPGVLKYQGETLKSAAAGNENLQLLVQALENFHYEALSLTIDVPEFGEGLIALSLEGNNPDVLDGHPFDVTINLESDYGTLIRRFFELYREVDLILQGSVR